MPFQPTSLPLSHRLRRGELLAAACPSRDVLRHVTSRWGVMVLLVLADGTQRFSGLRRKIGGVSEKMLAQTLQWLEHDGLVVRHEFPVVPPHVEYSLTPRGQTLAPIIEAMEVWGTERLATGQGGGESAGGAMA